MGRDKGGRDYGQDEAHSKKSENERSPAKTLGRRSSGKCEIEPAPLAEPIFFLYRVSACWAGLGRHGAPYSTAGGPLPPELGSCVICERWHGRWDSPPEPGFPA